VFLKRRLWASLFAFKRFRHGGVALKQQFWRNSYHNCAFRDGI